MSQETDAINRANAEYRDAVDAGDLDRWVRIFTDDALYLAPDLPVLKGKQAIRKWAKESFFDVFNMRYEKSQLEEIEVAGSWAHGRGVFICAFTPKAGGGTSKASGKYFGIFRKQPDGSWKWSRLIFNWDAPLGGGG